MRLQFTIVLVLNFSCINAQLVDSLGCSGNIGDLKYSILELPDFQKENGNCWVLMAGQNKASTKFGAYGIQNFLDARGLFIRTHDDRQGQNSRDKDRSFSDPTGTEQGFAVQSHSHAIDFIHITGFNASGGWNTPYAGLMHWAVEAPVGTQLAGHTETRPANMNFHLYIFIN
jgi:hypothetical protein